MLVRAIMVSAAFAGLLTALRCLGQYGYVLPEKAIKELSPDLLLKVEPLGLREGAIRRTPIPFTKLREMEK